MATEREVRWDSSESIQITEVGRPTAGSEHAPRLSNAEVWSAINTLAPDHHPVKRQNSHSPLSTALSKARSRRHTRFAKLPSVSYLLRDHTLIAGRAIPGENTFDEDYARSGGSRRGASDPTRGRVPRCRGRQPVGTRGREDFGLWQGQRRLRESRSTH